MDDFMADDFLKDDQVFEYSELVTGTLGRVMGEEDPFHQPDFDVTAYINALFPTEQSLSKLDETIAQVTDEMTTLDTEMAELVQSQSNCGTQGQVALEEAKSAIQELFTRIREIKAKTDLSESMVKEITRDIKQLDVAKKNLTSSITTLNHLHMLLSGMEALSGLVQKKEYADIANLLPGILNVLEHFEKYMAVPQIKELADQVHAIRVELKTQVSRDFKEWFGPTGGAMGSVNAAGQSTRPNLTQMLELCRVVSVLDPGLRSELSSWYVQQQMAEYSLLYDDTQDDAWLDKIDQRYGWFRNTLVDFEQKSSSMFPEDWDMPRRLTLEFCNKTKAMLEKVIQKRHNELDMKLLLHAIQRTRHFESLICKRFPFKKPLAQSASLDDSKVKPQPATGKVPEKSGPEDKPSARTINFEGIISRAFENYLYIYVNAQDQNLNGFLDQCVSRFREEGGKPKRELSTVAQPLPSSGDLFIFFKKTIIQVSEISTDPQKLLCEVVPIFKRYLKEYAIRCLTSFLPKISSAQVSTTTGLIQSLLKEGEVPRLSEDEQFLTCCILTTAEFCADTTAQLESKLSERISDPAWQGKIELSQEQEYFHSVTSSCLAILVQDMDSACDAALQTMTKVNWASVDSVGDESPYVASIKVHLIKNVPRIRDYLGNARRYFVNFCNKLSQSFMSRFLGCVLRCRPLSLSGAEQLLLDTHSLKTFLLELPSVDSIAAPKPPAVYQKPVVKGMTKVEMVLKVVMAPLDSQEGFVNHCLKLIPEGNIVEFQRILEMKNLRRAEQSALLEQYKKKTTELGVGVGSRQEEQGTYAAPILQLAGDAPDSRIRRLEKLVKKRL